MAPRLALVGLALITVVGIGCGGAKPADFPVPDASDARQDAGDDSETGDASDAPLSDVAEAPSDAMEAPPEGPVDPCSLCSPNATCLVRAPKDGGADADAASAEGGGADGASSEGGGTDAPSAEGGTSDAPSADDGAVDAPAADTGASDALSSDGGGTDAGVADAGAPLTCACNTGFAGDGMTCVEVATGLLELRWSLPCGTKDATDGCSTVADMKTTEVKGQTGKTYSVTLRFRGVVEQKTYQGGTGDGYWLAGATAPIDGYNVYELKVSSPAQVYYLNAGASGMRRVFAIDYTKAVDIDANATVTLTADPVDGAEIRNTDGMGHALAVPGIQPYPGAFDGQFIQMDVLSVVAK